MLTEQFSGAVLCDREIKEEIEKGNIIIRHPENLKPTIGNCSVDVTLGAQFFRQVLNTHIIIPSQPRNIWGFAQNALPKAQIEASQWEFYTGNLYLRSGEFAEIVKIIKDDEQYIVLRPRETILAHTTEFIGGRHHITTMLKARSSMARCNITICRDAGWGDVGYTNRWGMTITNNNDVVAILKVGERVGQIIFLRTGIPEKDYATTGNYQSSDDIEEVLKTWKIDAILPKGHTRN